MVARRTVRLFVAAALASGLAAGTLTGCGGEGSKASCSASQCTVIFNRNASNANIKILGVEIQVVSATDTNLTLKVAGQEVTIDKNSPLKVGDLELKIKSITPTEVTVEVTRTAGN